MTGNKSLMPSLLDVEIDSAEADAFGHRHFARALQGLIESLTNEPPYSIGLLGKWGTGKSSIKAIYLRELRDDLTKDSSGLPRNARIQRITFNAWRFGGENIKRALLRHVYLALEGDAEKLNDALFRQVQRSAQEERSWKSILEDFYQQWIWGALPALFLLFLIVVLLLLTGWLFGYKNPITGIAIAALGAAAIPIFKYLLDPKRLFIARLTSINRVDLPSSSAEQFEDLLLAQLQHWKLDTGKSCERLLIFVDDLDRLSAEEMVSGLDAVRTFMEIPRENLPSGFGIVFVISCDEERIAEALADRRRQRSSDLPGAVMDPTDARRFLDRIFQFRLEIPQFPKRDMRNYAMRRLKTDLSAIAKNLQDRGVSLETLIDHMIHVDVQSPRNALQILNAFAEAWWIASQRELEGSGTDKPGGLHEGAVTDHPLSLSVLSALKVDFPKFYEDLQKEPDLIKRFTEVFVDGKPFEKQSDAIKLALDTYAVNGELKAQYRPLRQFLAGVQGVRWPISLQPLLILSEDPITRKFGDKAPRLYDAFVSGDQSGVLANLGRDADSKPLSDEDVRLLHDMQEELRHEGETRRDNAARVIAALADRLPETQAHLLVSPLARRLAQSRELRSFIGVPRIKSLLPKALSDDRKEVAGRLIEDLLRTDGKNIALTLTSKEEPSLDEAKEMADIACELVLTVRGQDGLDVESDKRFLDWIESRSVSIADQTYEFPFAKLEGWMAVHEEHLLPSFRERYTDLVIAQLESGDLKDIDLSEMLRRARIVFDELWDSGEESRQLLWSQLARLVSVRETTAVALAWEFMGLHLTGPDSKMLTTFITNMAERLRKDMEEDNWELDWEAGGGALINLLAKRMKDVEAGAYSALTSLDISWSRNTDTGTFAVRLLALLMEHDRSEADIVIDDWSAQVITALADEPIAWLAREFVSLNSTQQNQIATTLAPVHDRTKISEQQSQDFATFIRNLPDDGVKSSSIQGFLGRLYPYLQAQHTNPNQYLHRVFPPLPKILRLGPAAEVGNMLHTLFANARSDLTIYAWLHTQMKSSWPPDSIGPYDPAQMFAPLIQSVRENPSDANAPALLDAAAAMVTNGTAGSEAEIIEIACAVWPHYQSQALSVLEASEQTPTTASIRALMDGVDYESDESRANLERVWSHFVPKLNADENVDVAKLILAKKPKGSTDDPDAAFRIWVHVQNGNKSAVLSSLLTDESLNDSQRKRVWLQIERLATELGKTFLIKELPNVFALGDSAETIGGVFESEKVLSGLFTTASDKHDLGKSILDSFLASSSVDAKNRLAMWLRNIDQGTLLNNLKSKDNVSDEDVAILLEQFPSSKVLKQMNESRKVEDAG